MKHNTHATRRQCLLRAAATSATLLAGFTATTTTLAQARPAAATPAPAARRLVLGQSVPLTGAAEEIGVAFAAGAKLYVDAWNARPASAGFPIELRQLDDGYDPRRAGDNARRLIAEGADLLFGFVGADAALAGAEAARASGAMLFAPFAAPDSLREQSSVFHVRPSLADEAFRMVRHCITLGQNRIAVVADDDTLGRAGLAAVNQAIAELKHQPLAATAFVPVNSSRVDAAVAAAINKAQPQAIIVAGLFRSTASVIRAMRASGYGGSFLNFSAVGIDPLFVAVGKDINGVVVSQVVPSPRRVAVPVVREYLAALEETDQTASYESLEGFIAAKALAEAARRAGRGADRAALQRAMAGMTDYDVGGFRINLRAGVRDPSRPIDLVTVTADGRVIR
ncbi:MAG: ABC transporter substrate-binding protein [Burkholderiaceae bacterium]|nr:ABC transporter substrate-binding protein [Burkholderiaceae bacterium]